MPSSGRLEWSGGDVITLTPNTFLKWKITQCFHKDIIQKYRSTRTKSIKVRTVYVRHFYKDVTRHDMGTSDNIIYWDKGRSEINKM